MEKNKFVVPYYLTVSSSGPAGEKQDSKMGVYHQSGETRNNKPIWSRHEGPEKLFYRNGKFRNIVMMISNVHNHITDGYWMIGYPETDSGGVRTVDPAGDQWPHQVRKWNYAMVGDVWQYDPQLTVTGNIKLNIL